MRATPYLVDALHLLTEFNECFAKVQVQQVVLSNWECCIFYLIYYNEFATGNWRYFGHGNKHVLSTFSILAQCSLI